ncbi:Nif3-like dinuclear metal center hexameric protein [Bifidobacterium sp. ESL0790]|uniref:Nif3-like dinuclear metal center hexameric protein n=1 Tax=Bifidobacterium sp. ESL0790 TaxID=2983233 RepID=UPI0023F67375|nr:Nif3-like dinuclear metal center hexameric protein [Bifidobacterium sp. ESL0790]WEV73044.1 Nif3-like dinuclear metal center hexameric protein [Bifidobacterium sp. ESL0790]
MTEQEKPSLARVVGVLETLYPLEYAEDWDHPGLIVGDLRDHVGRIVFAADPTMATIDRALAARADLLICHHPLLFRSVHEVSGNGVHGAIVGKLYRAHCALWVGHTNADVAYRGVAQAAADAFGLTNQRPLVDSGVTQHGQAVGLGRVGELAQPLRLRDFASTVARFVPSTTYGIQVAGDLDALVRKIAVLPGSGDSNFDDVRACGADVYVTSDLRHHPATDALEQARYEASLRRDGIGMDNDATSASADDVNAVSPSTMRPALINTPHSAIESMWFNYALDDIAGAVAEKSGYRPETLWLKESTDPWQMVLGLGDSR